MIVQPFARLNKILLGRSHPPLWHVLAISALLTVFWWLIAMLIRNANTLIIWADQEVTFTQGNISQPFIVPGFVIVPWAVLLIAPFRSMTLPVAVLVQLFLYFGLTSFVIIRYGGNLWTVILVLTSFIALDAAMELNVDWMVCIGLLLPPALSGPFLAVKPQDAFGLWLALDRKTLGRAIIVFLLVIIGSLLIWQRWPLDLLNSWQTNTTKFQRVNAAPSALLSLPLSVLIGLLLAWLAARKHDRVLGIVAGLFFVPYIAFYSLLIPFAVFAIRRPKIALLLSVIVWLIVVWFLQPYFHN